MNLEDFASRAKEDSLAVPTRILPFRITGVSVNPARSLGPALLVHGKALSQVWLFLVVPSLAGIVGGLLFRTRVLEVDSASRKTEVREAVHV
jgi:aquaporin Z